MRQPPSSILLLQLITFLLSISLSISRLHDPTIPTILNEQQQLPAPLAPAASFSSSNNKVPSIRQTIELAHLSSLVYYFRHVKAHDCTPFNDILHWFSAQSKIFRTDDATYKCHVYEQDAQDTQVIVISRTAFTNSTTTAMGEGADDEEEDSLEDYVAVVYAGTDDFKTFLTDAHVRMTKFGPTSTNTSSSLQPFIDGIPSGVNVHAGFNNAVFGYDLMKRVLDAVTGVMEADRTNGNGVERKVLTTGHSLGGADSVLCAVVLSYYFEFVTSVSVGCPKTGNGAWRGYVNSIPNVAVWRVVNKLDLVPRMPGFRFKHVGHTIQLGHKITKAYYHHDGDSDLGYRGVPFNWGASSYFLAPIAGYDHLIGQYIKYLTKKCLSDEDKYYVNQFERITDGDSEEEEVDERIDGEYGDTELDDSQREMTRQFFLELEADGKMQMKDSESEMIIQIANGEEEKYAQHYSKRVKQDDDVRDLIALSIV